MRPELEKEFNKNRNHAVNIWENVSGRYSFVKKDFREGDSIETEIAVSNRLLDGEITGDETSDVFLYCSPLLSYVAVGTADDIQYICKYLYAGTPLSELSFQEKQNIRKQGIGTFQYNFFEKIEFLSSLGILHESNEQRLSNVCYNGNGDLCIINLEKSYIGDSYKLCDDDLNSIQKAVRTWWMSTIRQ